MRSLVAIMILVFLLTGCASAPGPTLTAPSAVPASLAGRAPRDAQAFSDLSHLPAASQLPVAGASGAQPGNALVGMQLVTWQGLLFSYDPQFYHFETLPDSGQLKATARLAEIPDPCPADGPAVCWPLDITLDVYANTGFDARSWVADLGVGASGCSDTNVTDAVIEDRIGLTCITGLGDIGSYRYYIVPLAADMLVIGGERADAFVRNLHFAQPNAAQLAVGQVAMTARARALDLWAGDARAAERPLLYGGSFVTILAIAPHRVQVRTSDGVVGWIANVAPAAALTATAVPNGEQAQFMVDTLLTAQVVHPNGIPLREKPLSTAPALVKQLQHGEHLLVLGVRGDWLRVFLPDSDRPEAQREGWVRWYYDGARYVDLVE